MRADVWFVQGGGMKNGVDSLDAFANLISVSNVAAARRER
jgi:hypothetical protein